MGEPQHKTQARIGLSWGTARYATHLWVLVLALLIGTAVPVGLRHPMREVSATLSADRAWLKSAAHEALLKPSSRGVRTDQLTPLTSYVVQPGDTIPTIADRAGISAETLIDANHLVKGLELVTGEILVMPPVDGKMVKVKPGQSLADIASAHHAEASLISKVNKLAPSAQLPEEVFVPAIQPEELPPPQPAPSSSETRRHLVRFNWPTQGTVTQVFWSWHPGIDIANGYGTPEVAADGGRVVFAGWGAYGIYVEIDHGNGFSTVYGHMSKTEVAAGQHVMAGQLIGLMGATGRATGSHLHFEVRYNGVPQNPIDYLQ